VGSLQERQLVGQAAFAALSSNIMKRGSKYIVFDDVCL
jgi:hypothetical protein